MCAHVFPYVPAYPPGTAPPTNVRAERASTTSIRVSWTPSSDATGYRIDYTSNGGSSVSVTVSGGTTNERLLAGLLNGAIYTTSIVATSTTSFPSESVEADMTVSLGKGCPFDHGPVQYLWACVSSQFQTSPVSTLIHQQHPPPSPSPGMFLTLW